MQATSAIDNGESSGSCSRWRCTASGGIATRVGFVPASRVRIVLCLDYGPALHEKVGAVIGAVTVGDDRWRTDDVIGDCLPCISAKDPECHFRPTRKLTGVSACRKFVTVKTLGS